MTRSFVAIEMPEPVAEALAHRVSGLRLGRPVPPEAMHLTLAFLGEVSDDGLEELHDALSAIRAPAPDIVFDAFGHFGDPRPRALHAAVRATPALVALQAAVLRAARRAGLAPERRRFVPHVTLARFRGREEDAAPLARFIGTLPRLDLPGFRALDFALIASELHPDGARYEVLAQYPLAA